MQRFKFSLDKFGDIVPLVIHFSKQASPYHKYLKSYLKKLNLWVLSPNSNGRLNDYSKRLNYQSQ